MLDLDRLDRIRFSRVPRFQQMVAAVGLMPQYKIYPRLKVRIEGYERIPTDEPAYLAMNHTDRYNYFPFLYQLWLEHHEHAAVWVKGKYYNNPFVGKFMEWSNLIPTPSKGYIVTNDFVTTLGRPPSDAEYQAMRSRLDTYSSDGSMEPLGAGEVPEEILRTARNVLGATFDPADTDYLSFIRDLFRTMMMRFVALNQRAFDTGLHTLVFPQGTRSIRLSKGHIGLAQMALHLNKTIIPIGCNGSDLVHPGDSPFINAGEVVYRIGEPIRPDDVKQFMPPKPFVPFTTKADLEYREQFEGLIEVVMNAINDLVDPPYKFADDLESDGVKGAERFI